MTTLFTSGARDTSLNALLAKDTSPVPEPKDMPAVTPEQELEDADESASDKSEKPAEVQQTFFAEDVIIDQPKMPRLSGSSDEIPQQPKWKRYTPLGAVLTLALLSVLTAGILLRQKNGTLNNPGAVPTPAPQATTELSVLQRELVLLEKDVEAADPLQAKLAFPPVNFELILEDATVLQLQNNNRQR
jgi:hypothetical protein